MPRFRRPANRFRMEALESRVNPATIEILSQTASGLIDVHSLDPQSGWSGQHTLTSLGNGYVQEDEFLFGSHRGELFNYKADEFLRYHSTAIVSGVAGTSDVTVEVQFRLNPDEGEVLGEEHPVIISGGVSQNGGAASASLEGPGISIFKSSLEFDQRIDEMMQIGATYTLRLFSMANGGSPGGTAASALGFSLAPGVGVVAQYDDAEAPDDEFFGHYISGVKLLNTFSAFSPDPAVKSYRLKVEGVPNAVFTKGRTGDMTPFVLDVGKLPAGPNGTNTSYLVRVEALRANGTVRYKAEGEIRVIGKVGMDLLVKAVLDEGSHRPVEEARIIAGVKKGPDLDFKPAIPDIPNFYQGKLALSFVKANTNKVLHQMPIADIQGGQGTTLTPMPAKHFKDLIAGSGSFDYDIILTAGAKFKAGKTLVPLSDPEHLRVIQQPAWLKKNATSKGAGMFVKDDDTAEHLGDGSAGYKFIVDTGKPYNLPLPLSTDTPFDILKRLKSGVSLEANFSVYASLFEADDPVLAADKFHLEGTFLGINAFEADLDYKSLSVTTASIDGRTLAEPSSVRIATSGPVDLVSLFDGGLTFTRTFGPWKVDVPVFTLGVAGLQGTVLMKGEFDAAITKLDLTGDVTFRFDESKIDRDATSGNLVLDVNATATATLGAAAEVSVNVLGYKLINLISAEGVGSIQFDLAAKIAGTFGGSKGIVLDNANTSADLTLGYNFDYDVSFLTRDIDPSETKHAEASETKEIWKLSI